MGKDNRIIIKLDREYYPKEAVVNTCCQFLEDNYVFLERGYKEDIKVTLTPKETKEFEKKLNLEKKFKNELMNNILRYNIAQKNRDIREYIVKTALFFSQPCETPEDLLLKDLDEAQTQNWKDDPLGIAIPWEERHKKKIKSKR